MSDFLGSVRRSVVFRPYPGPADDASSSAGGITEKIGSCLRKSRVGIGLGLGLGFLPKLPCAPPQPIVEDDAPPIRWRKGELIGCGAFGHVYMGMNLDSGELLAVKQVLIGASSVSKEKAQAHIKELEDEVKLLKNLSHANIVVDRSHHCLGNSAPFMRLGRPRERGARPTWMVGVGAEAWWCQRLNAHIFSPSHRWRAHRGGNNSRTIWSCYPC